MSKTWKLLGLTLLGVAFMFVLGLSGNAQAADLTVDNLTVTKDAKFDYPVYLNGNELKYSGAFKSQGSPQINFNIGGSKIYDDGNMTIRTDDFLTLTTDSQGFGQGVVVDTGLRVNKDMYMYYPLYFYGNQAVVNSSSTLIFRDPSSNSLMTITDAGTTGNVTVTGILTATGGVTGALTGNVTGNVTGNLTGNVTGAGTSTLNDLNVTTNIDTATLATTGAATIGTTLGVTGNYTSAAGSITLTAGTLSAEQVTSTDDMTVTDDLGVGGDLTVTGTFAPVTLTPTTLTVSGVSTFNGNTVIGSDASDTVQFNALAATALNMNTNIISNIGAAGTDFNATGGLTLADDLDMSAQPIVNIGNAGTDFNTTGGLTLNDNLVVSGAVTGGGLTVTGRATPFDTANGTIYYDTDTSQLLGRINGAWVDLGQTPGATGNLNQGYENFGAAAALIELDGGQGQTSSLTWRSNVSTAAFGDFIIDLNSTGDFKVQDAGTNFMTFNDDGTASFVGSTFTFGDAAGDQVVFTASIGSNMTFLAGGARTITGPSDNSLTVQAGAAQALNLTSNAASTYQTTVGGLTLIGETTAALTAEAGNVTITSTGAGNDIVLNSADTIDASSDPIVNIGAAGTDFTATGGLTLADTLTVTAGGATITAGNLAVNSDVITSDGDLAITGATGANMTATTGTLDFQASAGNLTLTSVGAGNDVNITTADDLLLNPGDDITVTLAAGGQMVLDAAATDSTTTTGVLNLTVDSLTTGNSGLYIDYEVLATAAGTQSVINIPQIANTGSATVANVYGIYLQGISANGGNDYAIYIPNSEWDYSIYAIDDAYFQGTMDLHGSVAFDGTTFIVNATQGDVDSIVLNASSGTGGVDIQSGTQDITMQSDDIILLNATNDVDITSTVDVDNAAGETVTFTTSDSTNGLNYVTINNDQNVDITASTYLLSLMYNANGDAQANYLRLRDNAYGDTKFQIDNGGDTTWNIDDAANLQINSVSTAVPVVDINLDPAGASTAQIIDIDLGTSAVSGNVIDVTFNTVAHTGNAIDLNMGTNVAGDAINIATAATTGHALLVSASGVFTDSLIDIDSTAGIWTGNMIEVTTGNNAATGDVFNLNIEANDVAVQSFVVDNAAISATAGWLYDINSTAAFTADMIDFVSNSAYTGDLINVDNTGNVAYTGNFLTYTTGTGDAAADVLNITFEAGATDMQAMVVTNGAISDQAGWLINVFATESWTGNAINFFQNSGVSTGDVFAYDNGGNTNVTGDFISYSSGTGDVDGDVMDITVELGATSAQIFDVNNAAVSDEAGWLLEVDTTGAWTGNAMDFDVAGAVISTGNVFDVTYSAGAHTGNAINLNMGTNVAGDAINIATAATTGQAIDLASTGDFQNNLINITSTAAWDGNLIAFDNTGDAVWTGNLFDVTTGAANASGNVIDVTIEAAANDLQVLVVNNSSTSDQAGWLIDVNTLAAFSGNMIDFNNATNDIWTGNLFSVVTGNAATGDVLSYSSSSVSTQVITIENQVANTQQGYAMAVNNQGAFTGSVIYFDDTGNAAWTGNFLDIQTGTGDHTGDIFNVQMEATTANDGQVLVVTNADESDNAGWLMSVDASAAWTANAINFVQSAGVSTADVIAYDNGGNTNVTGDFISYSSGTGDVDGDVMDITVELGATSAQIFDVNNAAVSDEAGWLLEVDTTGAWTGNMIDITSGAQAATGNYFDINVGNAAQTGDVFNTSIAANAVALQYAVVDNAAISATAGWLYDINSTAAFTANMIDFESNSAYTGNLFDVDNTGDAIYTGDFLKYTTGIGDANADVLDIAFEAGATDMQVMTVTNAAATDQEGWLMAVDTSAAWTSNAMDFDIATAISTGNLFDVSYQNVAHTGNAINIAMGTNVAGEAINITTAATATGHALMIDSSGTVDDSLVDIDMSAGDWQGNIFEVTTGSSASDGDIFNANIEANDVAVQTFVIDNDAVSTSAGWLMDVEADAAFAANMIDLDISAANTVAGDVISIDYDADSAWAGDVMQITAGTGAWTGSMFNLDGEGTIATGNMFTILSGNGANTGDIMNVTLEANDVAVQNLVVTNNAASTTDGWAMEVNTSAAWANNMFDVDVAGAVISTGNVFDVTYSAGAHTGNAIDLNMGTNVAGDGLNIGLTASTTGDGLEIIYANTRTTGSAIRITDQSTATALDALVNIGVTGTKDTNTIQIAVSNAGVATGNELDITYSNGAHTGNAIDLNMGTNVAGDAINIASSATTGNVMQIITDGAFTDSVIDIDANTGIWTGNMIEVTTGGNVATGDVMNVNIEAGDVGVQGFVVDNAAASSTDGWLMEVNSTAAWTNNMFDVDVAGAVISTGNVFDVTYSAGAHTGNAVDLNMGTNVAGDAINIVAAATTGDSLDITPGAARTDGSAIFITDASVAASVNDDLVAIDVTGTKDTNTIDIDVSNAGAAATGNELDITYSGFAHTGNAIDLNMGTNVAGDAINIATAATTGQAIQIDTTGIFTNPLVDINLGAQASTGNVLDVNMGTTATGSALAVTLGATINQAIYIDASTADPTTVDGVIDINWDSLTTGSEGINLAVTAVDDDAADTIIGMFTGVTIQDDTTATDTVYGAAIDITNLDTNAAGTGLWITANDAGAGVVNSGIIVENLQVTDIDMTDGIVIRAITADSIVDGLDVSDAELTNAINVGANAFIGSTGVINYDNFDVAATGNITVQAGYGLDTNGAGALELAGVNATSINICESGACDDVGIATNVEAGNTIAIGNGGDDTLSINGQYFDLGTTGGMTLENSGNNTMLTMDGTNVTSNSMIDLNTKNTQGDIINIDYSGATVPTGTVQGIDMDLSNLSGAAQSITAYHANLTDDGTTTTVGLDIDGTVEFGIDLLGSATNTADIRLSEGATLENTDTNTLTIDEAVVAFTGMVTADAYRVTNGTTLTFGAPTLTKANMQAATHWSVDSSGGATVIVLGTDGTMDAADVGRHLTFAVTVGVGAVTFGTPTAGGTTVTTIPAAGGALDAAGDYADCVVTTTTAITCLTYAQ